MRMGLREANQSFSKAVKAVKGGEEVILTERGKPIAVIKPLVKAKGMTVRRLEEAGLLRRARRQGPLPPWSPRPIKGMPLSETIREERESAS